MSGRLDKNLALARACGSEKGYDPIPPDSYLCFMDPEFQLTPTGQRALAWLRSKTMRGRRGGRSYYGRDERGELQIKHMAEDLGISLQHASKVMDELEAAGLGRRENGKRLCLWSKPQYDAERKPKGEEKENKGARELCTYKLPEKLILYLQSLDEKQRAQCEQTIMEAEEESRRIKRDAMAVARELALERRARAWEQIGFVDDDKRGRPKAPVQRIVKLTLEPFANSVHISEVQDSVHIKDASLYENPNSPVQNGASLFTVRGLKTSEVSEKDEPPPPTPLTHSSTEEAKTESASVSPVVDAVETRFARKLDPEIRARFAALASQHAIPAYSVCRLIGEKFDEKETARYKIHSPGALLRFLEIDLPGWIGQHQVEIESDRKWEEARKEEREPEAEPFDVDTFHAQMRALTADKGMP